ncbi:MAG: hypothetical protein OWQ50_00570 [Acidianus infernus]|nr:hypothetical protein [Acidianus infernus]
MMEILRFKTEEEYRDWLKWQSAHVKDKAKEYEKRYPNTVPIVVILTVDECQACWGEEATHVFLPPFLEDIVDKIVWEADTY